MSSLSISTAFPNHRIEIRELREPKLQQYYHYYTAINVMIADVVLASVFAPKYVLFTEPRISESLHVLFRLMAISAPRQAILVVILCIGSFGKKVKKGLKTMVFCIFYCNHNNIIL